MIRALFRLAANLAFIAATMAFLTAVSLFLCGAFLATWPILRKSPRDRRLRATVDLATAGLSAIQAFADRPHNPPNV